MTTPPDRPMSTSYAAQSSESRNWALAAHLSAFLGAWIALAFVGPLVVWLIKRENDPYAEGHAREALNFNLTMLLVLVIGFVLTVLTLGLGLIVVVPLGGVLALYWLVVTIIAAVQAANGHAFRYPLTIRFISGR